MVISPGHNVPDYVGWCAREDSNLHGFRHQHLKLACMPISPRALKTKPETYPSLKINSRHFRKDIQSDPNANSNSKFESSVTNFNSHVFNGFITFSQAWKPAIFLRVSAALGVF